MTSKLGTIGIVTALTGAIAAVILLAWTPQCAPGPLHYPFTAEGFRQVQLGFAVHHLGLVAVLVGFALSGAMGDAKYARIGAWVAVFGSVLLCLAEVNTSRFPDLPLVEANQGFIGASYGISTNLIGLGLLAAGIGAVRARRFTGWQRFVPLTIGVATFVELTPGMFGGFVIARLAIALWFALFGALGWALLSAPSTHSAGTAGSASLAHR